MSLEIATVEDMIAAGKVVISEHISRPRSSQYACDKELTSM